jgi:hypothetical protein
MKQLSWCKDDNVMNKMKGRILLRNNEKCKMLKIDIKSTLLKKQIIKLLNVSNWDDTNV